MHRLTVRLFGSIVLVLIVLGSSVLAQESQTIVIRQLMHGHHLGPLEHFFEQAKKRFNERYPNVEIELVSASGSFAEQAMVTTAAGQIFDVLSPDTLNFSMVASEGIMADLTPFVERDSVDLGEFIPISLVPYQWNGELLAMPYGVTALSTVSHIRRFEEAGLPTPGALGEDWTWATLREIAPKLSIDRSGDGVNDQFGLEIAAWMARLSPAFIANAGGNVFDAQVHPRHSTFSTDPGVYQGLEFYLDLYNMGVIGGSVYSVTAAMTFNHATWFITEMDASGPPFPYNEYEVAPYPKGPAAQSSEIVTFGFSLNRFSANKDIAWEWIKFLTTDVQNSVASMAGFANPTAYAPAISEFRDLFPDHPDSIAVWLDIMQGPDVRIRPVTPAYSSINNEFNRRIQDVLAGRENLQNFLIGMDQFAQGELNRIWNR